MSNMSYCRFENTSGDFADCVGAVEEALEEGMTMEEFRKSLSSYEQAAFSRMIQLCERFQEAVTELEDAQAQEDY